MARTRQQIFDEMKAEALRQAIEQNDIEMQEMLNNISGYAAWRNLFNVMAFCAWTLEVLWDKFKVVIDTLIAALTPHSLRWYRTKALAFQYGFDLIPESDKYNNAGFTTQQIADSKIVKYSAVNEASIDGKRVLLIKIAGVDNGGSLVQLSGLQEAAFSAYMERIKDAGNVIIIYNREADLLRGEIDVYYNPLLLDNTGGRLDGLAGKPLEEAARSYLLLLPFNGEFSNAVFTDFMQAAYGVADKNVFLKSMQRKIGAATYQAVANTFIPDAGYTNFETPDGLKINYIAHV